MDRITKSGRWLTDWTPERYAEFLERYNGRVVGYGLDYKRSDMVAEFGKAGAEEYELFWKSGANVKSEVNLNDVRGMVEMLTIEPGKDDADTARRGEWAAAWRMFLEGQGNIAEVLKLARPDVVMGVFKRMDKAGGIPEGVAVWAKQTTLAHAKWLISEQAAVEQMLTTEQEEAAATAAEAAKPDLMTWGLIAAAVAAGGFVAVKAMRKSQKAEK